MKRILLGMAALLALATSCATHETVRTSYGPMIPTDDGMTLPIARKPDSKKTDFTVELAFEDDAVCLRAPEMLELARLTFIYRHPERGDADEQVVDLDFQDRVQGRYVYSLPYGWFLPRRFADHVLQASVIYVPVGTPVKTREATDAEGHTVVLPDFSGYSFRFNAEEFQRYFQPFIGHLR